MSADLLPTAGRFDGKTHLLPIRVYYEDTDFSGIVYHASYLRFLERGRTDFLRLAGLEQGSLWAGAEKIAFVVRRLEIDYLKPARIDDALLLETRFRAKGYVRLIAEQTLMRGTETLIRAKVEAVMIDGEGRPAKPPQRIRDTLAPLIESD